MEVGHLDQCVVHISTVTQSIEVVRVGGKLKDGFRGLFSFTEDSDRRLSFTALNAPLPTYPWSANIVRPV